MSKNSPCIQNTTQKQFIFFFDWDQTCYRLNNWSQFFTLDLVSTFSPYKSMGRSIFVSLTWGSMWWQGLAGRTSKGVILCFKGLMHFHLSPCNSATTINKTWLRRTAGKRGMLDVKKSHSSSPTELPSEAGELRQLQWEEPPAQPTLN